MAETQELVRYELEPPAAVLTINRPDKRNALSRALIAALTDAFRRAAADSAVRAVVLTGSGTAFCTVTARSPKRSSARASSPSATSVSRSCPSSSTSPSILASPSSPSRSS